MTLVRIFPTEKGSESSALDGGRVVVGNEDALLHQRGRAGAPAVHQDNHQVWGRGERVGRCEQTKKQNNNNLAIESIEDARRQRVAKER